MAAPKKCLSEAELDIMMIVWDNEGPIGASTILAQLKEIRQWSLQTLYTALSRLENKGYLSCDKKGRNKIYKAITSENEYKQYEGQSLLRRIYGNSMKNMIISLYNGNSLNKKDISELREFLNIIEGDIAE